MARHLRDRKKYITKEFQFIPALDNIKGTEEDLGALGAEVLAYTDKDQALAMELDPPAERDATGIIQQHSRVSRRQADQRRDVEGIPNQLG